jgi:hypothetical protein
MFVTLGEIAALKGGVRVKESVIDQIGDIRLGLDRLLAHDQGQESIVGNGDVQVPPAPFRLLNGGAIALGKTGVAVVTDDRRKRAGNNIAQDHH